MKSGLDPSEASPESQAKDAYNKQVNKVVKHLFDSSYVRPQDNYRVVQDNNPVKAAAISEAQKRYEAELAFKAEIHARNMAIHSKKIA